MSIGVLIADDQPLVRARLRTLLAAEADIDVVGEAQDGADAVERVARLRPQVVLMDIRMPVLDGLEATRRILAREAAPRVIVLTTFDVDEYVFEALRAGASGFLLKNALPEEIVRAVRLVASGQGLIAPAVALRVVAEFGRRVPRLAEPPELTALSDRERQVVLLVARGHNNAEIAERLFLSHATVKSHLARILGKLGLRDRIQLVVLAYECGLVVAGGD